MYADKPTSILILDSLHTRLKVSQVSLKVTLAAHLLLRAVSSDHSVKSVTIVRVVTVVRGVGKWRYVKGRG